MTWMTRQDTRTIILKYHWRFEQRKLIEIQLPCMRSCFLLTRRTPSRRLGIFLQSFAFRSQAVKDSVQSGTKYIWILKRERPLLSLLILLDIPGLLRSCGFKFQQGMFRSYTQHVDERKVNLRSEHIHHGDDTSEDSMPWSLTVYLDNLWHSFLCSQVEVNYDFRLLLKILPFFLKSFSCLKEILFLFWQTDRKRSKIFLFKTKF